MLDIVDSSALQLAIYIEDIPGPPMTQFHGTPRKPIFPAELYLHYK